MPGHFTHVYTARQLAQWLGEQDSFNPLDGGAIPDILGGLQGLNPKRCSEVMQKWPIYTNVGAIGPDLFFFSQDYSSGPLAAFEYEDDLLMLAMAVYYWIDHAKDEEWEPLLVILAEVDNTFANIVRLLIKLKKLWDEFVEAWDATIGAIVDNIENKIDQLTGGLLTAFGQAVDELVLALETIAEEELVTFADIFSWFSLKMRAGWDEKAFLWSDMLHYRRTTTMARNLFVEAQRQFDEDGDQDKLEQFQAFAMGWVAHLGADTIDHSFVNEQCGGPFRTHWQRHHLVENHIDAHNYREAGEGGSLPHDPLAANETYPDLSRSAFVYAVALDEDNPNGWERPATLPEDRAAAKEAVDQDGFMPLWLADGIVRALKETYHHDDQPQPENFGGGDFQSIIGTFASKLTDALDAAGIDLDQPVQDVIDAVAPKPDFDVPRGYPMPWEVQTSYRFMISFYRLSFWGGFDLDKPQKPDIAWPPASDLSDLATLPDFSGPSSGDPVQDVCSAIKSFFDWLKHEAEALKKLIEDVANAIVSVGTYPLRWGLYQIAMWAWDMVNNAHEILAHTGFVLPHGELVRDGRMVQPNEIDHALIQLGNTVDQAFLQALSDATDPFGNLDRDPSLIIEPTNPRNDQYPFLPVRPRQLGGTSSDRKPDEFHRPWAYPILSRRPNNGPLYATPTELSDVRAELTWNDVDERTQAAVLKALGKHVGTTVSGPYPTGALPSDVMFRTDRAVKPGERSAYERAVSPAFTDAINEIVIGRDPHTDHSPMGDAIPFSSYLLGRVLDTTGGPVPDFNLDADRGYGYRCWDWIRGDAQGKNGRGQPYPKPVAESEGSPDWHGAAPDSVQQPIQLHYLDGGHGAGPAGGTDGGLQNHGPLTHGPVPPPPQGLARIVPAPRAAKKAVTKKTSSKRVPQARKGGSR